MMHCLNHPYVIVLAIGNSSLKVEKCVWHLLYRKYVLLVIWY